MKNLLIVLAVLMLTLGPALPAAADEISDQIQQELKYYQEGKLSQALGELEFAVAQLKQKKAEALAQVFPEAPPGWQAQKGQAKAMGAEILGGGISASRSYQDAQGGRVQIEIMADSPIIQSLAMLLSNPMFAQGGGQNRLIRFKGHKAFIKYSGDKRAELQALIDNKVLLKVSARRVEEADKVVLEFAQRVDLEKLSQLAR